MSKELYYMVIFIQLSDASNLMEKLFPIKKSWSLIFVPSFVMFNGFLQMYNYTKNIRII